MQSGPRLDARTRHPDPVAVETFGTRLREAHEGAPDFIACVVDSIEHLSN